MVKLEQTGGTNCLRLIPNRSATWQQTQLATALVGGVALSVAVAWSLLGFWLILPFAGVEVAVLYYLSYRVCSATYQQQLVLIRPNEIEVQWGQAFPKRRRIFERQKTELEVVRPHHSLSAYSLFLTDGAQKVAVADQLSPDDVNQALACLQTLRLPVQFVGRTAVIAKNELPGTSSEPVSS